MGQVRTVGRSPIVDPLVSPEVRDVPVVHAVQHVVTQPLLTEPGRPKVPVRTEEYRPLDRVHLGRFNDPNADQSIREAEPTDDGRRCRRAGKEDVGEDVSDALQEPPDHRPSPRAPGQNTWPSAPVT